ncbi:hypothetical protein EC973_005864 [Apophysomyces ossiformis]|uniref:Uncharacterized protein n=1 Tax=Apophysomyces ossiformis TaxID=679940 RepID=A0A8H7EQU9_9FUNG|nr:hypothetical protein EC973_005864 [Apophysomyces ossiformis]
MIAAQSDSALLATSYNNSRTSSVADSTKHPETMHKNTAPASPTPRIVLTSKAPRSRRSSVSSYPSSATINTPMERLLTPQRSHPLLHSFRMKAQTRRGSADTTVSSDCSFIAGSIADACGMDIASTKRNNDFHTLFRSIPLEDMLIEGNNSLLIPFLPNLV